MASKQARETMAMGIQLEEGATSFSTTLEMLMLYNRRFKAENGMTVSPGWLSDAHNGKYSKDVDIHINHATSSVTK